MISRFSIWTIIFLAVLVWGTSLYLLGIELDWDHAKPFTITVAVVGFAVNLFDSYLWAYCPSWIVRTPNISGTWKVEINSTYKDPKSKSPTKTVVGYAVIRQRLSTISIRLLTKDSSSRLIAHKINLNEDRHVDIFGAYQSDPVIQHRGVRSEIHYGAFKLSLVEGTPQRIEGHYWTDRHTTGSIHYSEKKKELASDYESASSLYKS